MLKKVDRLELAAYELANAASQTIPDQYRSPPTNGDFIAESWKDAFDATIHAWSRMFDLGTALREKAGIPGDGPTANCRLLRRGETPIDSPCQNEADDGVAQTDQCDGNGNPAQQRKTNRPPGTMPVGGPS